MDGHVPPLDGGGSVQRSNKSLIPFVWNGILETPLLIDKNFVELRSEA